MKDPDIPHLPSREEARRKLLRQISEMMEIDNEGNIVSLNVPVDVAADVLRRYMRDFMTDQEMVEILRNEPDLKDETDEQAFIAKKTSILMKLPDVSN